MWTPENKVELGFYHQPVPAGYRGGMSPRNENGRPEGRPLLSG
jgi:hypothetical protein